MAAKPVILLVEDNKPVSETITENLAEEGYSVIAAASAEEMTEKLRSIKPDTILLDLGLPDGNGLQLIKNIREHTDAPVIVISGKADLVDKVVGLEMGADDYIGKPLQMKEVAARVKAQLRRYKAMQSNVKNVEVKKKTDAARIKFDEWILDREKFQAFNAMGNPANLTIKEFRLLETLVLEAGRVLSREQLLDKARAGEYNTTDRAIDVQVVRIRKKLGDTNDPPSIIKAIRGVGYTLEVKTEILE